MAFLNWLKPNRARTGPTPTSSTPPPDEAVPPPPTEPTISLQLQPVLRMIPINLEQPALRSILDSDEEIALPLRLIESQLSSGRVIVKAAALLEAMPEQIRGALGQIDSGTKVPIPLEEIFRKLPNEAIKLRDDQVVEHPGEILQTPFTEKAQEDAKRFAELGAQTRPGPTIADPDAGFPRLNSIFVTDERLDLPGVLAKVAQLPDIKACLLTTGDGRIVAGSLGDKRLDQALQTLIPGLFDQSESKLNEAGLSPLQTITCACRDEQLSSFGQDKVYLTVLHGHRPFKPGVREKLFRVLEELAKMRGKSFA
jgi:hypothetical protein